MALLWAPRIFQGIFTGEHYTNEKPQQPREANGQTGKPQEENNVKKQPPLDKRLKACLRINFPLWKHKMACHR